MVTSTAASSAPGSAPGPATRSTPDAAARELRGTPVVSGLAHGPVLPVRTEVSEEAVVAFGDGGLDPDAALAAYVEAAEAVARGFVAKAERATGAAAEVLTASAGLTRDPGLKQAVGQRLTSGETLPGAVRGAVAQFVEVFTAMGGLMAERATDLLDIERRVVARVVGEPEPGVVLPEEPSVLVAVDLAPADTASLDPSVVVALVTERGGPTSHTAIIARQLGLPCVVGCVGVTDLEAGTAVLVDGARGTVATGVDPEEAAHAVEVDREQQARVAGWTGPGQTRDGVAVKLLANVADAPSARSAAGSPVQGVGLFRTELCFLDRSEEPSADEQADIYAQVLEPFADSGHVVVRTLDAGSDKPVAFATLEDEENPALGVRGLRLALGNPGLLHRQLDGIAEAARRTGAETWVMAPMVATLAEAEDFCAQVRGRGLRAGVMVEVPSVALLADRFLDVVDFLSIGTNDLTQYVMAADRLATDLAHLTDPWQPAVLHLVARTAEAGQRAGKPVGICGEAAADPLLAVALTGMGITSLSMAGAAVRAVGAQLAAVDMDTCRRAADAVLEASDPLAARDSVRRLLD